METLKLNIGTPKRMIQMMAIAAFIGAFSGVVGLYASYYLNIASGAAVVLVATIIFVFVFLFVPGRGVVWRSRQQG